ncbi:MAG: galactokinase [candidate division WOR-3 bacterium]
MVKDKSLKERIEVLKRDFKRTFGDTKGIKIFNAPGRVNIIGEHTDYNGGYVLPIAINLSILGVARKTKDRKLHLKSKNFEREFEVSLDELKYDEKIGWANYPLSIAWVLQKEGLKINGAEIIFEGNIPVASGLSSSAAIEVLTMKILLELSGETIEEEKIPILCRKAENEFIGVKSGIMDQFVITFGKKDNALFLNCETLDFRLIPFHNMKNKEIIIGNTKIKRALVKSAYNERLRECSEGLEILKKCLKRKEIKNLSCIKKEEFEEYKKFLPLLIAKRCEHVIYENERVLQAVDSLEKGDLNKLGELMILSHKSLKDLYEVSSPELDIMVSGFLKSEGVYGARMTGAGFGGCTIALIEKSFREEIIKRVSKEYEEKTNIKGEFYVSQASDGARKIN